MMRAVSWRVAWCWMLPIWGDRSRESPDAARAATSRPSPRCRPTLRPVEEDVAAGDRGIHLGRGGTIRAAFVDLRCRGVLRLRGLLQRCANGWEHQLISTGLRRKAVINPTSLWANTVLANVKNALLGTYRHIALKHAPRYVAGFQYRFDRRFPPNIMLTRVAYVAVRTRPMPYRRTNLGESRGYSGIPFESTVCWRTLLWYRIF